jgi:leader peptidase (prepilin peptidase)/N-methyltransferase
MIEAVSNGWPLYLAAGLFGLLVGSFLNVVILRLPARLMHEWRQQSRELLGLDASAAATPGAAPSGVAATTPDGAAEMREAVGADAAAADEAPPPDLVFKGSHCPQCKHALSPLDNIPVLSWVVLRGRCRYCKAPISAQYPLVELLSAAAALVVVWKFGFSLQSAAGLALSFSLIALSGIDLRTQLLPDNVTLPLLWLGLLLSLPGLFVSPDQAILGGAIGYLSLWSVYWLFKLATGKEGMGYGDFKLLGALGAWMGPMSLLPIVLVSSLLGAILGSIALAVGGKDRSTPIPFGPFLAAAGWIQFTCGDTLQRWYTQLLFSP